MRQSHSQKRVTKKLAVVPLKQIDVHSVLKTWLIAHMGARTVYRFAYNTYKVLWICTTFFLFVGLFMVELSPQLCYFKAFTVA